MTLDMCKEGSGMPYGQVRELSNGKYRHLFLTRNSTMTNTLALIQSIRAALEHGQLALIRLPSVCKHWPMPKPTT